MKRIIILGSVVFGLAILYTIAWFIAAGQISSYAQSLALADGETTPRLTCGSQRVTGFPFGFDVSCDDATVVDGDVTATVKGLQASVQVYNPFHVLIGARSPLNLEDAFTGSKGRLDFASAEASARLTGWRIGRVSLVVEQPVWNDAILDDRLIARAAHAEAHLLDLPKKHDAKAGLQELGAYVKVDGLDVPGVQIAGGSTTLEAQITNVPDDVRTYGNGDLPQRWQAAGGQLIVSSFKGGDATGTFDITGNYALDSGGHVDGQTKFHSMGIVERIEAEIPEQFRGVVLGTKGEDGSYSQTINIAAGVVFAGLVPVAMIPPLW